MLDEELKYLKTATLAALVETMKAKAPYLKRDAERVARLSASMATYLGVGSRQVQEIRDAGLLHDIGMISMQEAVLQKSGPLTEEERKQVKHHVLVATEILLLLPYLGRTAEYVLHHHERLDGSGYPDGLRDDEIPRGAQIVGVADAYAALTEERPYRPALSPTEAIETLRGGGGGGNPAWFDDEVLDALEWAVLEELTAQKGGNPAHIRPLRRGSA